MSDNEITVAQLLREYFLQRKQVTYIKMLIIQNWDSNDISEDLSLSFVMHH